MALVFKPAPTAVKSALNVALVGFGFAGQTFHAPFLTTTSGLNLRWVVSSNLALVQDKLPHCKVGTLEDALADSEVDLVVIATPNDTHAPLARQALLAGKHVVIDKPFALDVTEARELIALAEARQLLLSVFHNRRWDGDFLTLQALLAEGVLGEVTQLTSSIDRYRPEVRVRWREGDGPGAGLCYDLAPHLLDQALQLFGPPTWLQADISTLRQGGLSDDAFTILLGYDAADGRARRRVSLSASCLCAAPTPRFMVHGTLGSWLKMGMDSQEEQLKAGKRRSAPDWGVESAPGTLSQWCGGALVQTPRAGFAGDYGAYYRGIAAALLTGSANPVPASEALAVMQLLDAARDSSARGERMFLHADDKCAASR
ncbi:MAG: oxidoreductase [Aeromonas sp.]